MASAFDRNERSELIAIADPDGGVLDLCRGAWGDRLGYYEDYMQMLGRADIDSVVVASPDHAHHRNAIDVLEHGKNLLLEKPMAQSIRQCDEIVAVMRARGVPIIDEEDPYRPVINSQKALGPNRPSMWQDLNRGLRTEIDALNGAIVKEAERHGLSAPMNDTIVKLIHSRERYLKKEA